MKVLLIFALIAATQASGLLHAPVLINTGSSTQYRAQDSIGNYNFGYNEGHLSGGSFRKESGDVHGNVVGSYGLHDADGRARVVNYVADAAGFRADIQSNEPGVEPKDPASATINKALVVAPAVTYAAAPLAPAIHYAPSNIHYAAAAPLAYGYASSLPVYGYSTHGLALANHGLYRYHL